MPIPWKRQTSRQHPARDRTLKPKQGNGGQANARGWGWFGGMAIGGLIALGMVGCALYNLRETVETVYNSKVLVGTVTSPKPLDGAPIVVLAYSKQGGRRDIAHHTLIHQPGPYELMVPQGAYFIFAFVDKNRDLIYQAGEPAGQHSDQALAVDGTGGVAINVNVIVGHHAPKSLDFPPGTPIVKERPEHRHSTSPGAIVQLRDPLFDDQNGVQGYWAPLAFFREIGGNIYFLRPYDPTKIPVLYVHGATGSPRGWEPIVSRLDDRRFQYWFYYYPSGASIKSMADLLFWKIYNLQIQYRFPTLYIVAHSMGGLVVRSLLVDYGQQFPFVKKFVSISTPWRGDRLSEMGVKYSPGVIPAWKDMGPQSEFARSIYRKPLPEGIDFYLLFGHQGNRNPFRPNNDGIVTLESQLDPRAQMEAKMVFGFKEDHTSILSSKRVATLINTILAPDAGANDDGAAAPKGMLAVRCIHVGSKTGSLSWPQLYFIPLDQDAENGLFSINMGATADKGPFGPIPPGTYSVSLVAENYRATPSRTTVCIGPNETPTVEFQIRPEGSLVDFVKRPFYQEKDPAGIYTLPAEDITIQRIRLTGAGIDRTLVPIRTTSFDVIDHYLSGEDWAYKSTFAFYRLPQGDYTVTIEAKGYRRLTVRRHVVPGQPGVRTGIDLTPLAQP